MSCSQIVSGKNQCIWDIVFSKEVGDGQSDKTAPVESMCVYNGTIGYIPYIPY